MRDISTVVAKTLVLNIHTEETGRIQVRYGHAG
jgi:hypothetical protein